MEKRHSGKERERQLGVRQDQTNTGERSSGETFEGELADKPKGGRPAQGEHERD